MDIICNETSFLVSQSSFLMFSVFCFGFIDNSCLKQKKILTGLVDFNHGLPGCYHTIHKLKTIFCTIAAHLKYHMILLYQQEAQLMLTTGSTRLAVSQGQQTWYHSTCYI